MHPTNPLAKGSAPNAIFDLMKKPCVVVTGGAGYIGSHTVVELSLAGFHPVILDNFSNSNRSALDGIERILGSRPEAMQVDCRSHQELSAAFDSIAEQHTISGVIHFAAFKAVGESTKLPLKYYDNNVGSTSTLLQTMAEFDVENLVFSSSCTVYGQPEVIPVDEGAPILEAESPYGYTKQACERIIRDVHASDQPLNAALLRYFNPIGAHESGQIGEFPTGIPNNLMPYITQTAAGVREKLMVFGNDYPTEDGTPIRDYIHVVDLAEAHLKALQRLLDPTSTQPLEVFNLGTGKGFSVLEMIIAFEAVSGSPLNYEITERRPGDVPEMFASTALAKQVLNWEATRGLQEMIQSSWTWEQNLRNEI